MKKTGKTVKKYTALYRSALLRAGMHDAAQKAQNYAARLTDMYASDAYRQHDRYPTMRVSMIYAVITMCLELKDAGLQKEAIIGFVNDAFRKRKQAFIRLKKSSTVSRLHGQSRANGILPSIRTVCGTAASHLTNFRQTRIMCPIGSTDACMRRCLLFTASGSCARSSA